MAKRTFRGAGFDLATAFGTTTNVTAATNAASSVFTAVAATLGAAVGDYVEILSGGWPLLIGRVFRISVIATNDHTLEGCDTSDTGQYPALGGVGTQIRRISTWTALSDIQDLQITGGEQQFTDVTGISDVVGQQFPTLKSALSINVPVFYDPSNAWVATVRALAAQKALRALRVRGPDGLRFVQNGYVGWTDTPRIEGDILRNTLTIAGVNLPTVYSV